jgi:hypothetical protein
MEKETHMQPIMKRLLILSLTSKQNVLISSGTLHLNVNSQMTNCKTNNDKNDV